MTQFKVTAKPPRTHEETTLYEGDDPLKALAVFRHATKSQFTVVYIYVNWGGRNGYKEAAFAYHESGDEFEADSWQVSARLGNALLRELLIPQNRSEEEK